MEHPFRHFFSRGLPRAARVSRVRRRSPTNYALWRGSRPRSLSGSGGGRRDNASHRSAISDRGGRQQIYVMAANGGEAQRISFGEGAYSTPVWSPRGDYYIE